MQGPRTKRGPFVLPRFRDTWGYWADFSVMVGRDGIVASKVIARLEPRESRGLP